MDDMEIYEVEKRTAQLLTSLLDIWEGSVRATHHFLSDAEIDRIREYVPQALTGVKHLIVAKNDRGEPVAFMGTEQSRLEMLLSLCVRTWKKNWNQTAAIWRSKLWDPGSYGQRAESAGGRIL